jgi:hypothetical protein
MKPAIGQYWKDTVNGDLLKVLGFSVDEENKLRYVKSACFVAGEEFLGIQEMQEKHFEGKRFVLFEIDELKAQYLTAQLYRPRTKPAQTEKHDG